MSGPSSGETRRLPVSCFIIAKNEADRIGRTIAAVAPWLDEVIVIDSGSTDGTQKIAEAAGARVMFNAWSGFGQQKRFGESQCRNDWILNVDADEVVSPELKASIEALFAAGAPSLAGYSVRISIVYPGKSEPRLLANDHYAVRLYDRTRIRYKDSTLFDRVDSRGEKTGHLGGLLYHYSLRSFSDLARKQDERSAYNAHHSKPRSCLELGPRLVFEFPVTFLKYYFVRTHILGGWAGLKYASIISYYRWLRIVRMMSDT